MSTYYTVLTAITCSILIVLHFIVMENGRIEKRVKYKFYLTYAFIAAAALCEYGSVALNGAPASYSMIHSLVKSLDYALTPVAGIYFVKQIAEKDKFQQIAKWFIAVNGIVSFLSNFTGWYFYLDDENVYHHGPLYFIYMVVYVLVIAFAMNEFMHYAKKFTHKNYISIIGIWLFMVIFITVQEIADDYVRVDYLVLSVSCVMVFAHYIQYCLQETTETIAYQKNLLERDPLTNLYNRYAYIQDLENFETHGIVPSDLIAISLDVNGLKKVNDNLGHQAGDELLCGAAQVIRDTFGPYGKCFRTGGDEFIVLMSFRKKKMQRFAVRN